MPIGLGFVNCLYMYGTATIRIGHKACSQAAPVCRMVQMLGFSLAIITIYNRKYICDNVVWRHGARKRRKKKKEKEEKNKKLHIGRAPRLYRNQPPSENGMS